MPLGVAIAGANTHDMRLVEETLRSVPVRIPSRRRILQRMFLDRGYDYESVRRSLVAFGYIACLPTRGDTTSARPRARRDRRWVVERLHSWMNRFRRLLIRWEKKPENYLAMIHVACAFICCSAAGVLG